MNGCIPFVSIYTRKIYIWIHVCPYGPRDISICISLFLIGYIPSAWGGMCLLEPQEEFIHFGMDLEFLLRRNFTWRTVARNILFREGYLVELAEHSEEAVSDE